MSRAAAKLAGITPDLVQSRAASRIAGAETVHPYDWAAHAGQAKVPSTVELDVTDDDAFGSAMTVLTRTLP